MNEGFSPNAFRNKKIWLLKLPSSTYVSGQSALIRSSFSSRRPLLRTSNQSVSKALGVRGTTSLPRDNLRSAGSRRKGPNS